MATLGAYRVRFRAFNLRPGDHWSTVQTDPRVDVRSTRWIGKTVEVVTLDQSRDGWMTSSC